MAAGEVGRSGMGGIWALEGRSYGRKGRWVGRGRGGEEEEGGGKRRREGGRGRGGGRKIL